MAAASNRMVTAASLRATLLMRYHNMFPTSAVRNSKAMVLKPNTSPFLTLTVAPQAPVISQEVKARRADP